MWFVVIKESVFFVSGAVQQSVVDLQLVSDSLVFLRKKTENAKMAAVFAHVSWHLVEGLRKIDNAAVSVPPVHEITDYTVLVAFTNQIIKDGNFLVVNGEFFEWNNFISKHFNDLTTNIRVNI